MAGEFIQTAKVLDLTGLTRQYRGTGQDVATSSGELKSKLKTVVGASVKGVSNSEPMVQAEVDGFTLRSVAEKYADGTLSVGKVVNGKLVKRSIPLQDVTILINGPDGKPNLTTNLLTDIATAYEDPDFGTGWAVAGFKWESNFSGDA